MNTMNFEYVVNNLENEAVELIYSYPFAAIINSSTKKIREENIEEAKKIAADHFVKIQGLDFSHIKKS